MAGSEHSRYAKGGELLEKARTAAGFDRDRVAAIAKVAESAYRNWENGHRRPRRDQLAALVATLWSGRLSDVTSCAAGFGLSISEDEVRAASIASAAGGDDGDDRERGWGAGLLKGNAVPSLLERNYRGTLRCGLPVRPFVPPWRGMNDGDFRKVTKIVRDSLVLALDPKELSKHGTRRVKLSDLEVYLVGDESFNEFNCHGDSLLLVCPGCAVHDGLLLVEIAGLPAIVPHFARRGSQQQIASVLGVESVDLKVLGSILATTKYRERSIAEQPILIRTSRTGLPAREPSRTIVRHEWYAPGDARRIGVPDWPDTLLLAHDVLKEFGVNRTESGGRIEFIMRHAFAELRADFRAGMLDALLGPEELWGELIVGKSQSPSVLYEYVGNNLYPREGARPTERLTRDLYPSSSSSTKLPSGDALRRVFAGKTIATLKKNDDHELLARFFVASLDADESCLSDVTIRFRDHEARLTRDLDVHIVEFRPEAAARADFVWWGVTIPPEPFKPDPIIPTAGLSPITQVHLFVREEVDANTLTDVCNKVLEGRKRLMDDDNDWGAYEHEASSFLNVHLEHKVPSKFDRVINSVRLPNKPKYVRSGRKRKS